jgi:PBP1b-binding outer membrane lipoprotein LpoB
MKIAIGLLGAALLLAGCVHHKPAPNSAPPVRSQQPKAVIKPDLRVSGRVAMVNAGARFVVITFPPGPVPQTDHCLNVYRNGLKVGEIKVSGPQRENDTVADITAGDVQLHDEVKEE